MTSVNGNYTLTVDPFTAVALRIGCSPGLLPDAGLPNDPSEKTVNVDGSSAGVPVFALALGLGSGFVLLVVVMF